ncbi:MAG: zinc metallopeptidase [Cyclobacteriaceae bacterium]
MMIPYGLSPLYIGITVGFMILGQIVSYRLKSKFKKYSKTQLASGMSGKEVAERMLRDSDIHDVQVVSVGGRLTDHYNPANKTVNLSEAVYHERNAAATAVAAHECGHAVQHARAYSMLKLRSSLVPIQNIASKMINIIAIGSLFGGAMLGVLGNGILLAIIAVYAVFTLFSMVTLPVEFDASNRALQWISANGIVTDEEYKKAKDALFWAAMTYVVAALAALANLLYYVMMFLGRRD